MTSDFGYKERVTSQRLNDTFAHHLDRNGDTMMGPLQLLAPPSEPLDAVTKDYVDSGFASPRVPISDTPPQLSHGKLWVNSADMQLYVGYDDGTSLQWVCATNNQGPPGIPGPPGPRGAPGHDDTLYIPELFNDMAAYWPGQMVPQANLPVLRTVTETVPWTTLGPATSLDANDGLMIGNSDGTLLQTNPTNFATLFGPYIINALGLSQAPAFGLSVTGISVAGANATITGKYLDNNFHAGLQYSLDNGNVYLTPAPADMTLTPSGSGGTYSLVIRNLASQFWTIKLRLNANNATVTTTDFFQVGTAATIGFLASNPIQGGLLTTAYGVMGVASGYINGFFPALTSRYLGIYSGPQIASGNKWFGNKQIHMPAKPGTYLYRIRNSPEDYAGSPYTPYDSTVVIQAPLIPALWVEPVPVSAPCTWSAGPYPWNAQWGYSKPPSIEWRVAGGNHSYDTGWTDAHATINDDGSITFTMPKIDMSYNPPLPADNSWTNVQWRRSDNHQITTPLYAMLP